MSAACLDMRRVVSSRYPLVAFSLLLLGFVTGMDRALAGIRRMGVLPFRLAASSSLESSESDAIVAAVDLTDDAAVAVGLVNMLWVRMGARRAGGAYSSMELTVDSEEELSSSRIGIDGKC